MNIHTRIVDLSTAANIVGLPIHQFRSWDAQFGGLYDRRSGRLSLLDLCVMRVATALDAHRLRPSAATPFARELRRTLARVIATGEPVIATYDNGTGPKTQVDLGAVVRDVIAALENVETRSKKRGRGSGHKKDLGVDLENASPALSSASGARRRQSREAVIGRTVARKTRFPLTSTADLVVTSGRDLIGTIRHRRRGEHTAFGADGKVIGTFGTRKAAADAINTAHQENTTAHLHR